MEISFLELPVDVLLYIFQKSGHTESTRCIICMTCKFLYSLFTIHNHGQHSRIFLQEDNILWYRNNIWDFCDILLYGGIECLRKLILEYNPSNLYEIYKISATKGYLEILELLDGHYSEHIKLSSSSSSSKSIRDDHRYEYIFIEQALPNLRFCCCDYLFEKCSNRFYYHGIDELPDDLPIDAWHYLVMKHLVSIESIIIYATENTNTLLIEVFQNK